MSVTDTLRRALETCGQTRAEVSRATGIDQAVLSRFVMQGKTFKGPNLDALCKHLGLSLQPTKGRAAIKTTKTNARKGSIKG